MTNQGGPSQLEVSKRDAHLHEGPEGRSREQQQACQYDFGGEKGYGADHLECHHMARTGQPDDQAQSARVYERCLPD